MTRPTTTRAMRPTTTVVVGDDSDSDSVNRREGLLREAAPRRRRQLRRKSPRSSSSLSPSMPTSPLLSLSLSSRRQGRSRNPTSNTWTNAAMACLALAVATQLSSIGMRHRASGFVSRRSFPSLPLDGRYGDTTIMSTSGCGRRSRRQAAALTRPPRNAALEHSVSSSRTLFLPTCTIRASPTKTTALQAGAESVSSSDTTSGTNSSEAASDVISDINPTAANTTPGIFPRGDALDSRLIKISLPVIANFAIGPLIGAVDLFWVNQMGDALAVAGQSAANQVFNSVFWLTSFLPAVTATLISRENAGGNTGGVQQAVRQALLVGWALAVASTMLLLAFPSQILSSVLKDGAPALAFAKPYLLIRALAFLPSLTSLVGFSAFRGVLDTITPVKISLAANLINCVLDPILIFTFKMGVPGAALATLVAELASGVAYLALLKKRQLLGSVRSLLRNMPTFAKLKPLLKGGAALQLRNVALNLTFLAVARVVQSIDETGVAAAAHALSIQTFQVGGIVLLALSTVAQTVVPNDLYQSKQNAKSTVNRLMGWGLVLGVFFGILQLALVPVIQRSSPLLEVREAARVPALLASVFQVMNGLVFIGEGIMIGTGNFFQLSLNTVIATAGCLWALGTFPPTFGLTGVWFGFGVFNSLRLLGVAIHQFYNGPLASRHLRRRGVETTTPHSAAA